MPPSAPKKGLLYVKPSKPATGMPRRTGAALAVGSTTSSRVGPSAKGGDEGYLYLAGVRDASKRVTEFSSERDVCPICHTDRQFNPSLRLLVSPCYHRMCESCIDRLFTLGPEPCPTCGRILRKVNFQHQTFEDLKVEREVSVRRRMAEHFNKRESDFTNMRDYDDYLENVENWTFNLLNDIDIEATEKAIQNYINTNKSSITSNRELAAIEKLSQAERDEIDKQARSERMKMIEEYEKLERSEEERIRVEIVDALAKGNTRFADEIRKKGDLDKIQRSQNLEKALPALINRGKDGKNGIDGKDGGDGKEDNLINPLGYDYIGPYVPIPYNPPEKLEYLKWFEIKDDYKDGRSWVIWAKEDKDKKIRGGGWDLKLFWKGEIESSMMSLGIEPLT